MAKISVLVPVYNVAAYLEQCLDSLTGQTFQDIEIICVDDGSTDSSGRILDRYAAKDSRIKVIHKANTGYGNSMNAALDCATGEYVAIVESDDYAEPDMLEKLYKTALQTDAEVVKANYFNRYSDRELYTDRTADYPKDTILNKDSFPAIFYLADTIWSCLYWRSFLVEHGIRFHETSGASYQDISFALQVWIYARKVYLIKDAVLHYRRDNPGSSMNNPDKLFCVFDEYDWIEEKFKEFWRKNPELEPYFVVSRYRDYLNHYFRVGVQYQYAFLLRLRESYARDREDGRIKQEAFPPQVWERLCAIEENENLFFRKTAKRTDDIRLKMCRFENEEVYADGFFRALQGYPQTVIYGAGQVGKRLAKEIVKRGGHVECFVVTSLIDQERVCMGVPLYELADVSELADTCAVVIAVTERMQYEFYQNLIQYGFQNIFRVDETIRKTEE